MLILGCFLVLSLLFTGSHQYVEEILMRPAPITADKTCKNCDLTEMPDGTYYFNKCDAYSQENCGADVQRKFDCCVGYQLFKDTRMLFQADTCKRKYRPWLTCIEAMTLRGQIQPVVAENLKALFETSKLDENDIYTIFVPIRNSPYS
ncbi:hypothetical protein Ciccas_012700 [Cichlidogyrus casuarinus]|uniref:Uncharacterized protein n=1 Tax=Cichlidogyrus casuarinus TaxID=1844966 RepID=A0ABD2PN47_9PLAT